MKKILTLFSIFLIGAVMVFLVFQYNQKTTVQLSIQESLESSVETVMNSNLDSSYRVYQGGNSLVNPHVFEEDFINSFSKYGAINMKRYTPMYEFKYLIKRGNLQRIIQAPEYQEGDVITAVRTTVIIDDQEYTASFILDIKD